MDTKGAIVVTGANTGIGKAICAGLAQAQRHVVMVSRDLERGQRAHDELRSLFPAASIELLQGDLGSIASTEELADSLLTRYPSLCGLINNAGIWMTRCTHNEDELERSFMVNHLAPFLLSRRLFATLRKNAPARIVNVNAGLYIKGHFAPEQTPYGKDFHPIKTYAHTKLWNVLFTVEMARRIAGSGVTINAIHPGVIRTKLGDTTGPIGWFLRFVKLFWASPEEGADGPVWLATDPAHHATNGLYFDRRQELPLADNAKVPERSSTCWTVSEALLPALPKLEG